MALSWTLVADKVKHFDIDGNRIGVVKGVELMVKEGDLNGTWVRNVADNVQSFRLCGDRIGFVRSGSLWVKHGAIDAPWIRDIATEVTSFDMERKNSRIAVLRNGVVEAIEGGVAKKNNWTRIADNVVKVRLATDRLGILRQNRQLWIKEGTLGETWAVVGDDVEDFDLGHNRVGVVRDGVCSVNEGNMAEPNFTIVAKLGRHLKLVDSRFVVVFENQDLMGKQGDRGTDWMYLREDIVDVRITPDRVAALTTEGELYVSEGSFRVDPPAVAPPPSTPETTEICKGDKIEPGWMVTDTRHRSDVCGKPSNDQIHNVWVLTRYNDVQPGNSLVICKYENPPFVPKGWQVEAYFQNLQKCKATIGNLPAVDNCIRLRRYK